MKIQFFIVALLCASSLGLFAPAPKYEGEYLKAISSTFEQYLDHFSNNDQTWKQRMWIYDEHFTNYSSPIIFYINGEAEAHGLKSEWMTDGLAKELGACVVTLEHRFYGASQPLDSLSTANLKYLSAQQALADIAHFMHWFQDLVDDMRQIEHRTDGRLNNKWITIGGSYSGALSAWFRRLYPELTSASLSSSGVVEAVLDFTAFDKQIAKSAGPTCAAALRATTKKLEEQYSYEVKALFDAEHMEEGDFWYLIADAAALAIQYGSPDVLCGPMSQAYLNNEDLIAAYANYTQSFFFKRFASAKDYSTAYQQQIHVPSASGSRQWWWQKCTEFAYFQNAPAEGSIRSQKVNMDYHRRHCKEVFGTAVFPDTDATNKYFGGRSVGNTSSHIFFANGSQDPWQHAAIVPSDNVSDPTHIVTCHNCGHCVDLRGCPGSCAGNGENDLYNTRAAMLSYLKTWLAEA
eukprot:GCRY01000372.1.p1 GENE.GCRY01000372.1~~GCRY01000372.1.p1  ORF type:complete len:492 (+),score=117.28 GCRY01000372.1:92-1477(+)